MPLKECKGGCLFLLLEHSRRLQSAFKRSKSLRFGKLLSRRLVLLLKEVVDIVSVAVVLVVGCHAVAMALVVHRHHKTSLNHDLLVGSVSRFASACCGK